MRMFCTSTQAEYDYLNKVYGYPKGYVKLTGLCRYDNLNNFTVNKKQILLMPTWRQWIAKEVETKEAVKKLNWSMYAPQIVMLAIAFLLGIYLPNYIANLITNTVG